MVRTSTLALILAGLALPASVTAQPVRDDSRYRYALTQDAAMDCTLVHDIWSRAVEKTDPEVSRQHLAMLFSWMAIADKFNGAEITPDEFNARYPALAARAGIKEFTGEAQLTLDVIRPLARTCEIISNLHDEYLAAVSEQAEKYPETFADKAAMKSQSGEVPLDLPAKTLTFRDWEFNAKGNSCIAVHEFDDGTRLTLGFTNFFDGAIRLEGKKLPKLDPEADDYDELYAKHSAGGDYDEETFRATFAEGVTYADYPGTAIFVDELPLALMQHGAGAERQYLFGAYVQGPYYNALPLGKELTIKVLGKTRYSLAIDDPAFWNEMSNCMAQYPYG